VNDLLINSRGARDEIDARIFRGGADGCLSREIANGGDDGSLRVSGADTIHLKESRGICLRVEQLDATECLLSRRADHLNGQ
jgi:hypothetical protein